MSSRLSSLSTPFVLASLSHCDGRPREFLKHKNLGVKVSNEKLKKEKSEYQVIFGELTGAAGGSGVRSGSRVDDYLAPAFTASAAASQCLAKTPSGT